MVGDFFGGTRAGSYRRTSGTPRIPSLWRSGPVAGERRAATLGRRVAMGPIFGGCGLGGRRWVQTFGHLRTDRVVPIRRNGDRRDDPDHHFNAPRVCVLLSSIVRYGRSDRVAGNGVNSPRNSRQA